MIWMEMAVRILLLKLLTAIVSHQCLDSYVLQICEDTGHFGLVVKMISELYGFERMLHSTTIPGMR